MENFIPAGYAAFLAYFSAGLVLLFAFIMIYVRLTPYKEIELIRNGNRTAALALAGNVLGYAVVLYTAMAHSVSWGDMLFWALVGLLMQYLAYQLTHRILLRDWHQQVENDNLAAGVLAAATSLAIGLLNAGSMTY
ncbi:MAG: DUF350 domain-containing protein [Formosimonas sp.]